VKKNQRVNAPARVFIKRFFTPDFQIDFKYSFRDDVYYHALNCRRFPLEVRNYKHVLRIGLLFPACAVILLTTRLTMLFANKYVPYGYKISI